MNSSGNTELSHKNGIHKSKRCYTSGFRREPTCYFFANAVKRQTHGRRKKKSYQTTIEKLTANKAFIYADLGSAVARQAKDDPTVLSPYPTQAAALNDIDQETITLRKRIAQMESVIQHKTISWTEICQCGAVRPQSAPFCPTCGRLILQNDADDAINDADLPETEDNHWKNDHRTLTGLQSLPAIPATRAAVESSRRFAYESAVHILSGETNICYSPVSLEMALLIAMQGAGGNTLTQLQRALACKALSEQDLASIYRSIVGRREGESQFDAANSLWIPQILRVNSKHIDATKRLYDTQVKQIKEFDEETNAAINNWIKEGTRSLLNPGLVIPSSTQLVIINTLYADGRWSSPFEDTKQAEFHSLKKQTTVVDFMDKTFDIDGYADDTAAYAKGDGWQRADLAFDNGGCMKILLPDDDMRFRRLRAKASKLGEAFNASPTVRKDAIIRVQLPKFDIDGFFGDEMIQTLESMGITDAFNQRKADFSALSDAPLFISKILQGTHIEVAEEGAKAAAYTVMTTCAAICPSPKPVERIDFIVDHPFLFELDSPDGLPLFSGSVTEL